MATVTVTDGEVRIRFSLVERLGVRRARLVVPLTAVRAVARVERPLAAARGARAGVLISGVLKIGVWGLGGGIRQLVSVRRGVPALLLTVDRDACGFDEVLVSVRNADDVADLVRAR